ncbi:hypothetical protein BDC45DRAFT_536016 [Circinella umbellata]|nr:hypothetical protein BDC45DRAFT_536016 [Circinella umbellata]
MRTTIVLIFTLFLAFGAFLIDARKTQSGAAERRQSNVVEKRNSYHGKATWFIPSLHGGSMGACWEYEADEEYVVAMNSVQYGDMTKKSGWCFKKVRIYHGNKHVDAIVKDACPECKYGDLDLTPPVFKALGDLDTGILQINWHEI